MISAGSHHRIAGPSFDIHINSLSDDLDTLLERLNSLNRIASFYLRGIKPAADTSRYIETIVEVPWDHISEGKSES